MLKALASYYRKNGILSTSFTCSYRRQCKGDCTEFIGPKSAFVSMGYVSNSLPRLLFLSLDPGRGDRKNINRLPMAVRKQEENRNVLILPQQKHWYRTHEMAWYILQPYHPGLILQDTKRYFAHTNSAKCCMNKINGKKANSILFKNCKEYLQGELSILDPDIIVSQGKEAKEAVSSLIVKRIDEYAALIQLNGRKRFWLHTFHPGNYGAFNRQRDFDKTHEIARGWVKYSQLMKKYV